MEEYPKKSTLESLKWQLLQLLKGIVQNRNNLKLSALNLIKSEYKNLSKIDWDDSNINENYARHAKDIIKIAESVLKKYEDKNEEDQMILGLTKINDRTKKVNRTNI